MELLLSVLSFTNILIILIGALFGLIIGSLPGLGATITIVLLLPFTYNMEPVTAILLLLSAYQSAEYGGSVSSIILGIPGTPGAVATTIDGHALAQKSFPGKALSYSLVASTIGGVFGALVLMFLTKPLTILALQMSDPEFFLIGILGILAVGSISAKDKTKGLISAVLGLMAATIGIDQFQGVQRFTLGFSELQEGIDMIALLVGMFAFTEIFLMTKEPMQKKKNIDSEGLSTKFPLKNFKKIFRSFSIGSIIGALVGIFPGMGSGPSAWLTYGAAQRFSKKPDEFGKGSPEGIAGPESANNATVGGSLVPLLSLGIPGSPAMAIIMGAFIIHGIQPGPRVLDKEPTLINSIFIGFLFTTIAMFIVGKLVTPAFSRILNTPQNILIPILLVFSLVGVFASRQSLFDVWLALIIGIIFLLMKSLDFSLAAFILAFVLGPIIEESLRRSLMLSQGSYTVFLTRPYSVVMILLLLLIIIFAVYQSYKQRSLKE